MSALGTKSGGLRPQRGAVTLIASLGMLLIVTVMTFVSAQVGRNEQRLASDQNRTASAYEAAEAAYQYAISAASESGLSASLTSMAPATRPYVSGGSGPRYAVEFCDLDTVLPSNPKSACTAPDSSDLKFIVYARGWSDDGVAVANIVSVLGFWPGFADTPANPLTGKGIVTINGSGDVTNGYGTFTIWSGGTIDFTNGNFKTNIKNPVDDTCCVEASKKDAMGVDVVQNDGSITGAANDEFFAYFFGVTPSTYRSIYAGVEIDATDSAQVGTLDGMTDTIVWVEGDLTLNSNTTIGTVANPVIMVVNGNFSGSGNLDINGMLYVTGDYSSTGNLTIEGAAIVQGDFVNGTGSTDINYNPAALANLGGVGRPGGSPGSWKDWIDSGI